jgi:hypothetical protein
MRRAHWTIFWERVWPALATLAWLGLWLWLPPLGRATAVLAFAIIALAAAVPFVFVRVPAIADGLRRLDHASGLRHRPATAFVDDLQRRRMALLENIQLNFKNYSSKFQRLN